MTETHALSIAAVPSAPALIALPTIVVEAGNAGRFAWEEYFIARIRNPHTRSAYQRAVRRFLQWLQPRAVALPEITPAQVADYFDQFHASPPTRKLHLAAIRGLFDVFVTRHLMVLNPASAVRGERYEVGEGKTPEITMDQTVRLITSIEIAEDDPQKPNLLGLRDRAIICVLVFTAARAGAVAKLRREDLIYDGAQYLLRFHEKGGKLREIPVRHDLQTFLLEYLDATGLADAPRDTPLFRSASGRTGRLTESGITGVDICRLVKRRLSQAGLPDRLSPHSFRVFTVTDLLMQGTPLEDVQYLAGHSDVRTTRLYDRRQRRVTRNIVERISLNLSREKNVSSNREPFRP